MQSIQCYRLPLVRASEPLQLRKRSQQQDYCARGQLEPLEQGVNLHACSIARRYRLRPGHWYRRPAPCEDPAPL